MTPGEPRPHEREVRDYWDALVAGESNLSTDLDPTLVEAIHQFHALDDVPAPEPALMGTIWQQLTGETVAIAPLGAIPVTVPAANGHRPADIQPHEFARVATLERTTPKSVVAVRLIRLVAIAVLAGIAAGFVAGLGARVAMRIAAMLAGSASRGAITENDAVVGDITVEGTLALAMTGAIFFGPLGGLIYAAVRGWLPGSSLRRGALYGVLLLGTFGFVVMDPSNPDYRRFGSPGINIGTFSVVYLIFGLITAPLTDWLDRRLPSLTPIRPLRLRAVATGVLLAPFGFIGLVFATLGVGFAGPGPQLLVFVGALYGLPAARWLLARSGQQVIWPIVPFPRQRTALTAYVLLAATSLIGLGLTLRAIAGILSAG